MPSDKPTSDPKIETWGAVTTRTDHIDSADGAVIAATLVHAADVTSPALPVVLIPGMFSNRHFWVSPKGIGLAAALAAANHPVWLIERRGLGRSPRPANGARAGLNEHLQHDLPAIQQHIHAHTPQPAIWGGHSFGGIIATRAVAETLHRDQVAGLLLFAAQIEVDKKLLCWPHNLFLRSLSRLFGRLPSRRMGLGPEDEPIAAVDDACRWRMNTQRGGDLLKPLANIDCPVLAFAGADDDRDPPAGCEKLLSHMTSRNRQYILLSESNGYSMDYDHPGIVVSKPAAREVWPQVVEWAAKLDPSMQRSV